MLNNPNQNTARTRKQIKRAAVGLFALSLLAFLALNHACSRIWLRIDETQLAGAATINDVTTRIGCLPDLVIEPFSDSNERVYEYVWASRVYRSTASRPLYTLAARAESANEQIQFEPGAVVCGNVCRAYADINGKILFLETSSIEDRAQALAKTLLFMKEELQDTVFRVKTMPSISNEERSNDETDESPDDRAFDDLFTKTRKQFRIKTVRVIGNQWTPTEIILRVSGLNEGLNVDSKGLDDARQSLHKSGLFGRFKYRTPGVTILVVDPDFDEPAKELIVWVKERDR